MRNLFKKFTAVTLSLSLAAGMAGIVTAAVKTGTDVSAGKSWTSYSIHTREDKGEWEDALIDDGQKYMNKEDAYKSYGEDAKITSQTASSFLMNVTSTGWSAGWGPSTERDKDGNFIYEVKQSNPWGVTATKVVNVERGRYYNISFKIKSTLENELTETKERADGTAYNEGTGKYNYIKHIHFKAFDNKDEDGAALKMTGLTATIGGKSALVKGNKTINKDFDSFVTLDKKNTADDGWVSVNAKVFVPAEKDEYQAKAKTATMGIKFAFGAFLKEYPDENNMVGTIEVKDFSIKADAFAKKPAKVKKLKVTAKKKSMVVKFKKAKLAKKYQIQYSLKKNFKGAKTKTTKKTSLTIKKLKSGKKYFVRVRGFYTVNGYKVCGAYAVKKNVKVK